MGARTFGNNDPSCLTPGQLQALAAIGIDASDFVDTSCDASSLNTCGRDAEEIVTSYPLYNENQGIYTRWGDIALPWNHEDLISDERWQIATYTDTIAYATGDTVFRFEDDGYRVAVYRAVADVAAPAGPFDTTKWELVCSVTVSEPVGLPDIAALRAQHEYYDLSLTTTKWSEFDSTWSTDLMTPDSDQWGAAQIAKDYFYREGDVVLYDTNCGDYTCVYVATTDMPASAELAVDGPPSPTYWQRQYCVPSGNPNTCVKGAKCDKPNHQLVSLSSGNSDLICVPVESTTGVGPRQ